jgi:spore germination protein KB
MAYNSGRMGMAEGIALAFIVTFPPVFLAVPASLAQEAGSLAWSIPLLGGLAGGALMFALAYVFDRYPDDLLAVVQKLLGKPTAYVVGLFYFGMLLAFAILWTRQFAENTLLTALPFANFPFIVTYYAVSAGIILYAGIEAICRATYLLLPFAITGLLLVLAGLVPVCMPYYLLPWQGNGLAALEGPVINQIGLSGTLSILAVLAPAFQNARTIRTAIVFGYGGSMVLRSISIAVFTMVFGANVAAEKTLPFYEMARLVYINRYLQRFEALFTLLWVMAGVLAIAITLYGAMYIAAKRFNLPAVKPLLPVFVLIVAHAAMLPTDSQSVLNIEQILYNYVFAPGAVIIPAVLFIAAVLKDRRKSCRRA